MVVYVVEVPEPSDPFAVFVNPDDARDYACARDADPDLDVHPVPLADRATAGAMLREAS